MWHTMHVALFREDFDDESERILMRENAFAKEERLMSKHTLWLNIPSLLLSLGCLLLAGNILPPHTRSIGQNQTIAGQASSCMSARPLDTHSLLIVLLDRSASLAQTDPEEYSISVTNILADLWPGRMAVIFFSGTTQSLPQSGPVDLTQSGARAHLHTQIQAQKQALNGNTPTQYAIEQAISLLAQNGYPGGSEVMLITDGQPFLPTDQDGRKQITAIEQQDTPAFCAHGVPVNTFGLGKQVPTYTQTFLHTVATETGGTYQDVTNPAQLAQPVLRLYANWQHLTFVSTGSQHRFFIDTYAGRVDFVAFLSNSRTFPVTLQGPNQQPVPAQGLLNQAGDVHYQFDQMMLQQFNPAGTYTIQTNDPGAQTYVLEETRLHVVILSPAPHASFSVGKPLPISVALYDDNDPSQHIHPTSQESVIIGLAYTLQGDNKTVVKGEKMLTQQAPPNDDIFSTQITPSAAGSLTLTISASYQYVSIADIPQINVRVLNGPSTLCFETDAACQSKPVGLFLLIAGILLVLLVLLVLFLVVWRHQSPFGFLENSQRQGEGQWLGHNRTFKNRLLHLSTVSAEELSGFDFQEALFHLQFRRKLHVFLVADQNTPSLAVWCTQRPAGQQLQPVSVGSPVLLHAQDRILVNGVPCATFRLHSSGEKGNGKSIS